MVEVAISEKVVLVAEVEMASEVRVRVFIMHKKKT